MNIALWIAQGLLTAMYLMVGSMKVFQPAKVRENPRMTWTHSRSDKYIRFVETTEVLGTLRFFSAAGNWDPAVVDRSRRNWTYAGPTAGNLHRAFAEDGI